MNGSIDNATIAAGGTSKVILAGLKEEATLNLAGTATVYLGVTSGDFPSPCSLSYLGLGLPLKDCGGSQA